MKRIEKRIVDLEEKKSHESELHFNCVSMDELTRMEELLKEDQLSNAEFKEYNKLHKKAERDARKEFMDQYDKTEPFNLRTVFNDYKTYQLKHGRTSHLGHAIAPPYLQFQQFLTDNEYQIQ